eukprot:scaffold768_cov51-Phaeocystis_antarctica.AAC.1
MEAIDDLFEAWARVDRLYNPRLRVRGRCCRSQDAGGGAFEVLPWVYVLRAATSGVRLQSGHSRL